MPSSQSSKSVPSELGVDGAGGASSILERGPVKMLV